MRTYGTKNWEGILGVCAEPGGKSVFLYEHNSVLNTGVDTLHFDTFTFIIPNKTPSPLPSETFLVRLDSAGRVLKARSIGQFKAYKICRDDSGSFYVIGTFSDTSSLIGPGIMKKNNGNLLILKFNKKLEYIWAIQTGNMDTRASNITFSAGRVYFICESIGTTKIGTTTYNFANVLGRTVAFGEIRTSDGTITWSNYLYNNFTNHVFRLTGIVRLNDKLYLSGKRNSTSNTNNLIINNDTFFRGGFVIETDSIGNYVKRFLVPNMDANHGIECIITDGEYLYIGGIFTDSFYWGSKKILSGYKLPFRINFFVASLTSTLQPRWFFHPQVIDSINPIVAQGAGIIGNARYDNKFLYFSGVLNNRIIMDNRLLVDGNAPSGSNDPLIFKTDLLGNILWVANGKCKNGSISTMDVIGGESVYHAGAFDGAMEFPPYKAKSRAFDGFITKITDNAIIRGEVSKGPYCAGDTISIPYKKIGDYDTANLFIAELSDENGNFTGGHRKIGQLKTNKDGTISGVLPLFQVASSPKYRIRILSTAPYVQSYFKVDTLRLLIYSRDKADPGADTSICLGDTVQIKTSGGTRWTWSEKYNMQDSSARETFVWPVKNTTYRIIISDSSGCGVTDTAFKTILVKKELTVSFITPVDTSVCKGGKIPLIAAFSGGDSCGYYWQWVSIDANGTYTYLKEASDKQRDTLLYTMPAGADSMQFVIYLNDSCTPKIGFATYTLNVSRQKAVTSFKEKDTSVCPGKNIQVVANFSKGYVPGYNWQWFEKNIANLWIPRKIGSGKLSDTFNYTLPLSWKGTKQLRVILKDNCSSLSDTAVYSITPRDTLDISLNTRDTTLCNGQSYTWKAKGMGGYEPGYQFSWTDANNGQVLSTSDTLNYTALAPIKINLNLSDGCMPKSLTTSFLVSVSPPLKSEIKNQGDTALCFGQKLFLQGGATGGKGSAYQYEWQLAGKVIGSRDSLMLNSGHYLAYAATTKKLLFIINDQCTVKPDTAFINIDFLPELDMNASVKDSICYPDQAVFKATGNGGTGNYTFEWLDENNVLQGNTDSLLFKHNNASQSGLIKRSIIIIDGCSENDTAELKTELLKPLSLSLSVSDTCPLISTLLTASISGGRGYGYKVSWWKENTFLASNSGLQNVFPDAKSGIFKAILTDGCSQASDTVTITLGLKPNISLSVKDLCLGDTTLARVVSLRPSVYNWKINNNDMSSHDSLLKIVLPAIGLFKIKVSTSGFLCQDSDSANVYILERPIAGFDYVHFPRDASGIPFHFINTSSPSASTWNWNFGNSGTSNLKEPDFTFVKTGTSKVTLIVSNQNTCFDTIEKEIPVLENIKFFFPNAFSPNANHINDGFGLNPNQYHLVKEFHLEIYNRWGEKMFETDDVTEQWQSGKYQQGIYIYKAYIRDVYNVLHEDIMGVVEVLR